MFSYIHSISKCSFYTKAETTIFDFDLNEAPKRKSPSTFMSFAPILIPILLIVLNQVLKAAFDLPTWLENTLGFIGHPIPAVAVGVILAIYGLGFNMDREEALNIMDKGVRFSSVILLVTGADEALGRIIQVTGVGNTIANAIADWGIPALLVPFLIATIVRFIQ